MHEDPAVASYLKALERTGNPVLASKESGLHRRTVSELREQDREFAKAYDEAVEQAVDLLEAEAWRRALEGVPVSPGTGERAGGQEPSGEPIQFRRYSDALLAMLLRGYRPEKFASRGRSSVPADPLEGLKDIAFDVDPPRQQAGHC